MLAAEFSPSSEDEAELFVPETPPTTEAGTSAAFVTSPANTSSKGKGKGKAAKRPASQQAVSPIGKKQEPHRAARSPMRALGRPARRPKTFEE